MERFAQLGKSCAPFARGDWNAALVIDETVVSFVVLARGNSAKTDPRAGNIIGSPVYTIEGDVRSIHPAMNGVPSAEVFGRTSTWSWLSLRTRVEVVDDGGRMGRARPRSR